jgi:UDP-N-acetylmuramoyl-tripeptide--D-alanyl-D-alanine ligase
LEGFGTEEGVRKAKGELFDHLRTLTHGYAFVMWDYEYLQTMSKGISGVIKYGTTNEAHVIGRVLNNEPTLTVEIMQGLNEKVVSTQMVGEYNLPNVLAAVTVGNFFKVPEEKIRSAIAGYVPSNSRSQLLKKGSNTIVMDAYNANPSSMKAAIENFANLKAENKVLLLGSMAELGNESAKEHEELIKLLKQYSWKEVVLVGKDFSKHPHSYTSFDNSEEAKKWFKDQDFQNTHVLVKGSRSTQMEKIFE